MYEEMTPEKIKIDILSALKTDIDKREGSFSDDMAGPVALELFKLYTALERVIPMVWVDETSGPYLDMAAEDLGIAPRKPGTKAKVLLMVSGTPKSAIPKGTGFLTADGILFQTCADAQIPESGPVSIEAEAAEAGFQGNAAAGAITYRSALLPGVSGVTNPECAQGGTDQEGDTALYERISAARKKPGTSGNVYDYERWALETSGVGAAKVLPVWDGPGTVRVILADENRQPVDSAIAAACAAHIEQKRPIGAAVTVLSAQPLPVAVSAAVRLETSADRETVKRAFTATLKDYFEKIAFQGEPVRYNRVGSLLMALDGVLDYSNLLLGGKQESLSVTGEQVPILSEVVLTWNS